MGKSLIGQIGIVAVLTILSKAGAFGKEVLLSYVFGAGANTDAYFIANAIPGLLYSGFLSTIALVFLPIYTRSLLISEDRSHQIINNAILIYAGIATLLSIFCFAFADFLVNLTAPGAAQDVHDKAVTLTRIFAFGFIFSGWVGIQNAIQQSNKSFILPITVPVFNHAVVIIGIIISMYVGGVILVASFAVLGWALQAPIHGYLTRGFYKLAPRTRLSKIFVRDLLMLSVPVFFSVFLDQINIVIDLVLSSRLGGGAISHLSYAARLSLFFSGLFSILVSYFIFPHLTTSTAQGDTKATSKVLGYGMGLVLVLTTPLLILSITLNRELIELIFQRGAFSAQDAAVTAEILKFYAIGMLFVAMREVFNRLFYSDQRTIPPLVIGAISAVINVFASLYLMQFIGVAGIAAGTSIGAAAYVIMQIAYIIRWDKNLISTDILVVGLLVILASAGMLYTVDIAKDYWADQSTVIRFILVSGCSGFIYLLIALSAGLVFRKRLSFGS